MIDSAPGLTFGFHLRRGNQDSRWLVAGGYDEIARPVFGGIHAHRLLRSSTTTSGRARSTRWPSTSTTSSSCSAS